MVERNEIPNRMTALGLLEQMRRRASANREPEFNPMAVAARERGQAPRAPLFGGQRQPPLPIPPTPPAVIPPQQPQQGAPQARGQAQALPVPPVPPAVIPQQEGAPARPIAERFNPQNPHVATAIEMAERYGLPRNVFLSLVQQESRFDPNAVSRAGALGLGQLMPGTARDLGVDPTNPTQNLEGSARYLRQQLDRFGGDMPLALAAYNAGPRRVVEAGNAIPDNAETQAYVPSVMRRAGVPGYAEGGMVDGGLAAGGPAETNPPNMGLPATEPHSMGMPENNQTTTGLAELERIRNSMGYAKGGLAKLEHKYAAGDLVVVPGVAAPIPAFDYHVRANRVRTPRTHRPAPREELTADQLNDMVLDRLAGRAAPTMEVGVPAEARERIGRVMGYAGGGRVNSDWSQYLPEDMPESAYIDHRNTMTRPLNVRRLIDAGAIRITDPAGDPSGEGFSVVSRWNDVSPESATPRWADRPGARSSAINALSQPGSLFDGKYRQILQSARELGLSPDEVFLPERENRAEGGLAELHQKYARGGEEISDEEYDRRLLERMKRDTGRTTESTNAEQARAIRSAGYDAAQLASDIFLPQNPLDAALMVALGPGSRMARLAGSAALAAMEPSEAEAGGLRRLGTRFVRRSKSFDSPFNRDAEHIAMFAETKNPRETLGQLRSYGPAAWISRGDDAVDVRDIQPDIVRALRNSRRHEDYNTTAATLARLANPENIVDSAGMWDDPQLVREVYENVIQPREITSVRTNDGLLVFDPVNVRPIRTEYSHGGLAQLEHKYADGGIVSGGATPYDPDAVNALANQIEAGYV